LWLSDVPPLTKLRTISFGKNRKSAHFLLAGKIGTNRVSGTRWSKSRRLVAFAKNAARRHVCEECGETPRLLDEAEIILFPPELSLTRSDFFTA
jgi:hypothetical protein